MRRDQLQRRTERARRLARKWSLIRETEAKLLGYFADFYRMPLNLQVLDERGLVREDYNWLRFSGGRTRVLLIGPQPASACAPTD